MPNPKQPRKEFGGFDKINELARSIEREGLIQPIIVRKMKNKNKFEIVVGERRWRACNAAGIRKIPAIVRDVNDHHLMLQSLIENLHRSDLTAIERENAVYELWKSGKYNTKRALGNDLGFAKSTINEIIEAKEFRDRSGSAAELSTRVITQTRGIKDDELRAKVIEKIHDDQISSNEVRKFVNRINKAPQHEQKKLLKENYKIDYEEQDVIEDEDQQELEKEKENTFITQIQRLDRTLDEFVGLDQSFLGSLTKNEKKDLKVKLGAIAVKLDTVMKKL